jgi:hypothetical protein
MVETLGLDHERVEEIVNSMPITLRENVTLPQAQEFASVLRELGALVFVEEQKVTSDEPVLKQEAVAPDIPQAPQPEVAAAKKKKAANWYSQTSVIVVIAIVAVCAALLVILPSFRKDQGMEISPTALKRMLKTQEKILNEKKNESSDEVLQESWFGEIDDQDINIKLAILTGNGKPLRAIFKVSTEFPGERSAEEIIRGKYRPWLRSGEGELGLYIEPEEIYGPKLSPQIKETLLIGAARIYMETGGLGSRIVADTNLAMAAVKSPEIREFQIAMRYLPKEKFINNQFFVDYTKIRGYSLVVNKSIVVHRREKDDAFFKDPYSKDSPKEKEAR